ncbi:MAG: hypothetical protein Q7U60_13055, partial [Candidatus Methanoperedens sp.]|nr:hypothetical protein [Candidatus Methanoperedens sp.]
ANVSCAICHGTVHNFKLPNATGTTSINQQCVPCHNITGGLNITANGGTNVPHDGKTDCKACHMDANLKLDSHLVPTAEYANANCTQCHDLGGKAPYHIDYNTFNKSNYVHNHYNLSKGQRPLNFNASNGSALRPAENKICWACHGNINATSKLANYSDQPTNDHSPNYKNPKTCEYCHQNTSIPPPFGAPQNVAHSYNNSAGVLTPSAPNCYDCHGVPAMYNNSNSDPDYNNSLKATLAYHYGTGFPPLEDLRHKEGYCTKYCHQNTSSPFKAEFFNEENMQRPNHSARNSRPANQSCVADACHAAYELHGEKMRKPTLASGVFNNSACTVSGCHNVSDPPKIDYKYHNAKVNCTACHMDNKGENIHPVKYLQDNGWDFAQVNTTAASCKLCHKNSQGDATLAKWGVTASKVGAQHHSDDPKNGSKWNKTIDPYWDYVPHEVTFVNGWKNNSNRGFITNFGAMNDTNYSAARISENTTADAYVGSHPPNQNFTSSASGWSASGTGTLAWSSSDGNPPGAITVVSTTKNQIVDANWTASFNYPRSGAVAEGIIKLDSKLVKAANINTGALKVVNVSINDNAGNVTEVYNRSLPNTAEPDWIESGEVSVSNPNTVFWGNRVYNVTIRTRFTAGALNTGTDIKAAYDNVFVNISEVDYKKYNFTFYINNTAPSDRYQLIVGYQTHTEPAKLYVLNGSSFQYRAALDSGAFTKAIIPLSQQEYGTGNVTLRINDSSGANDVDVRADYIDIEYMFIESYKWINNSRVHYPCEYCHASNKHLEHALGIPYEFKGNNSEGQNVNATTSWCASCHWQGYSSGTKYYNNTVQAFKNHSLPVPPEITGNATYGANQSNPAYKNHSVWGKDDLSCWGCHKGKLADGSNSTVFLHNLSTGTSGGRNCTACHNIAGSAKNVNFTSINRSMHANLNRNATGGNATNKPCWACHGTKNGTFANESDQLLNEHNGTVYNNPRKCYDCHNATLQQFTAKSITDHIPSGMSANTDVNTSSYNNTYCTYCHNNSNITSFDPDGLGLTGGSPRNASVSHYGANKTGNKLMSAASNSTDCVYCHRTSSNMLTWGILSNTLANISNKNATGGGTNHNSYTASTQCTLCHGYTVTAGFTFHNAQLGNGSLGGVNCTSCHNVGGTATGKLVNFTSNNMSMHANLNKNATSSAGNVINEPCWACHGTKNGTYANESDQPASTHNLTVYQNPRKCYDCHNATLQQFTAKNVTDHIPSGMSANTDVNTSSYNITYCTYCHNNSNITSFDPDGLGLTGGSPRNASVSHYGANKTKGMLMNATSNSTDCVYCHRTGSNMLTWGILSNTLANISNKNATGGGTNHNPYTSSAQCTSCHGYTVTAGFTFH